MKRRLEKGAAASALAVLAGVAGLLYAEDKTDKPPDAPPVRAEVRVDANARPDFSGTWKLNTDLSEDPREKMQEARGSSGVRDGGGFGGRGGGAGFGGGGRGGMGGGGTGGGGRRGGGDSGDRGDGAKRLGESLAAQRVLTISHRDPELVVRDGNGPSRTFFTDARKVEEERSEGTAKIQAKWKDRSVVVVTKFGRRETTETFERAADGAYLLLTTKIDGGRAPLSFRRVYESALTSLPAEGGAAEPKGEPKPPST